VWRDGTRGWLYARASRVETAQKARSRDIHCPVRGIPLDGRADSFSIQGNGRGTARDESTKGALCIAHGRGDTTSRRMRVPSVRDRPTSQAPCTRSAWWTSARSATAPARTQQRRRRDVGHSGLARGGASRRQRRGRRSLLRSRRFQYLQTSQPTSVYRHFATSRVSH
jgi:hypothetical protein